MSRITLSDNLKKAISRMPAREKDKLLFRLVAKEPALVEKLRFELLEGGDTMEQRREAIRTTIATTLEKYDTHYYSPGYLLLMLRDISGTITRHVRTTRDKYGEIELNLFLLNLSLELFGDRLRTATYYRSRTFNEYVVKRTLKILKLLEKMHEDLLLDFQQDLKRLGTAISRQTTMMKVAGKLELDVHALRQIDELP